MVTTALKRGAFICQVADNTACYSYGWWRSLALKRVFVKSYTQPLTIWLF